MPIIRLDDRQEGCGELRNWSFLRMMPGLTGKLVKRQLFDGKRETVSALRTFNESFASARCLVPMTAGTNGRCATGKR